MMDEQQYKDQIADLQNKLYLALQALKEVVETHTKDYESYTEMTRTGSIQLLQQQAIIDELKRRYKELEDKYNLLVHKHTAHD